MKLPSVIDDNMVLQQGKVNNIWGWAEPGNTINISFCNKSYKTITDKEGKWSVQLTPLKAGHAGDMSISTASEKRILKNILVGEVWLCSGQSNMEYPMAAYKDFYGNEMRNTADDEMRFVVIKNSFNNKEDKDVALNSRWAQINTTTVENCSAVAYFFAKKLRAKLKVPVGLIISSWGGTTAQAWVDTATLHDFPQYDQLYTNAIRRIDFSSLEETTRKNGKIFQQNIEKAAASFHEKTLVDHNDANWEKTFLPKIWEQQGHPDLDGIAAYRISFNITAGEEHQPAILHLPAIDDIDSTYINGVFIGSQHVWNELRVYNIPPDILKPGKNVISIWVEDDGGGGGLNEDADNYYIQLPGKHISLKGNAAFKILATAEDLAPGVNYASLKTQPSVLFNAMIAPLLPVAFRGVIWYQGESNTSNYIEYRKLFPSLINNWRDRFRQKELPFLFVQLSSYNPGMIEPEESDWAGLREAQAYALKLPQTGMVVSIDVGDAKDLHPKQKKEVGERLAANAFHIVYGFKHEVAAGPIYRSAVIKGNTVHVSYDNTGSGLIQHGNKLSGFVIAGADKKFVEATAEIHGNEVIVSNAAITAPMYVRYAWANAPLHANLYNKEGFPAAPFRTDK